MAPDLNTVPKSPRANSSTLIPLAAVSSTSSQSATRRTSTQMLPPPLPRNDSSLPSSPRPTQATMVDNAGVGIGPGPLRHPRPLTAAELHLELEKEQESIVNRLTRELSALRAQTASVASTTSSTSDHFFTSNDPYNSTAATGGTTITQPSARRHRSSSNLSTRSARSVRDSLSNAANTSVSGVAAPRDQGTSSRPSMELTRPDVSRQNSTSGFRSGSITSSPHLTQNPYAGLGYGNPHRSSTSSNTNAPYAQSDYGGPSPVYNRTPSASTAARYEEAALQRAELDAVKRENEMLKAKVKELERSLQKANEPVVASSS